MTELWELANRIPGAPVGAVLAFLLLTIVVTGRRGDWVWKRELDAKDMTIADLRRDRDEYRELYLRRSEVVFNAVDLAKQRRS